MGIEYDPTLMENRQQWRQIVQSAKTHPGLQSHEMAIFTANLFIDFFGITVAIFAVVYTIFRWNYQLWKRKKVPHFEPTFPSGNARLPYDIVNLVEKARKRGWGYFGMFLIARPFFVVLDLDLVKCILTKDFNNFVDRGTYYNEKDDPLSAHLFAIGGTKWRNLRTKVTPTFTSGKMRSMFETLVECGVLLENFLKEHDSREPIDIKNTLACFTSDIIGSCAFGLKCNSLKNPDAPFVTTGQDFFKLSRYRRFLKVIGNAFPNFARALGIRRVPVHVSKFYYDVVTETVDYRETNNVTRNDFLQLLIDIRNTEKKQGVQEDPTSMTFDEMVALCFVFFTAGYETSSSLMTFALYELGMYSEIQEKVREELFETLKKYDNKICYDSLKELQFMQQVLDETLRKYPTLPFITRQCVEDYKIPNTDIILEKGADVLIPVRNIHRDENVYKNADKFDPERFSPENKSKRHPYAHIPFGEGPRICIGARFGLMQAKVGLATVLKNFRVKVHPKTIVPLEIDKKSAVSAVKGGLWLTLEKL